MLATPVFPTNFLILPRVLGIIFAFMLAIIKKLNIELNPLPLFENVNYTAALRVVYYRH